MEENTARTVVDSLRQRGVNAQMAKAGVYQFGVRVLLPDGREAVWDSDGAAGLEAQVLRNGVLVGFMPVIEGSEAYDQAQIVEAIAGTDYDEPVARRSAQPAPVSRPLPRQGGVFRRFLDGFRYR